MNHLTSVRAALRFTLIIGLAVGQTAQAEQCGLEGDLEERIHLCSTQDDAQRGNFVLVTRIRSAEKSSIYLDKITNLLWTGINPSVLPQEVARYELCDSKSLLVGGIDADWGLPSVAQYVQVEINGARTEELPWWKYTFWTADKGWIFSTYGGEARTTTQSFGYFAQCVASADTVRSNR